MLKEVLFRRRLRMSRMLAMNNSLHVVVETLSKEFNVTPQAIYHDHANMHVWSHEIEQDKQLTAILRARLGLLSREALSLAMETTKNPNVRDKFVKIGAINSALKVTDREISLAQELGLVERKPLEVESTNRNLTVIRMWQPTDEKSSEVLPVSEVKRIPKRLESLKSDDEPEGS